MVFFHDRGIMFEPPGSFFVSLMKLGLAETQVFKNPFGHGLASVRHTLEVSPRPCSMICVLAATFTAIKQRIAYWVLPTAGCAFVVLRLRNLRLYLESCVLGRQIYNISCDKASFFSARIRLFFIG